jgi:hypothetical protein
MMRKILRWAWRILGGAIAFVILLVAIAIGVVHTEWGRQRMKKEIETQLQAEFPGSTVGSLQGTPFGTLIASGITIAGKDGRPFITIAELTIDASLKPLANRVVRVQTVSADGVLIDLTAQPDPKPTKPASTDAKKGESKPSSWDIELPDIAVHHATIIGDDGERVESIELAAAIVLHDGALDASVAATAKWRGQPASASATLHYADELRIPMAHVALGDAEITATAVRVADPLAVDGVLAVRAPAKLVAQLADTDITGDARAVVISRGGALAIDATLTGPYASHLRGSGHVDLAKLTGGAVLAVDNVFGRAVATLAGDEHRVQGLIAAQGAYDDEGNLMTGRTLAAVDVTRQGDVVELANALVSAQGKSTMYGTGSAAAKAHGQLSPAVSIAATGTADGTVKYDVTRVSHAHARFEAKNIGQVPIVSATVDADGIAYDTVNVPSAEISATATLDDTITVQLGEHRVKTADGKEWTGRGGTVVVDDTLIDVRNVSTSTASSTATASAKIARLTDDIDANVKVRNVAIAMIDPKLRGTANADAKVAIHNGSYSGKVSLDAHGVKHPDYPALDGNATVVLAGRRVQLDGSATSSAGNATFAIDLTGPRDITDPAAWQRLQRSALREARVRVDNVRGEPVGASGTVDGELTFTATEAHGKLAAHGIVTSAGNVDSTVDVATGADDTIDLAMTGTLQGVKPIAITANVGMPAALFSPDAWIALGYGALRSAEIRAEDVTFDRALLARFDVKQDVSGKGTVVATIGPAAQTATVAVDVVDVRTPKLRVPVTMHLAATLDAKGVKSDAHVQVAKLGIDLTASAPITLATIVDGDPLAQPLTAKLTVPKLAARDALALADRRDVTAGDVGGTIDIGGKVGDPTFHAAFAAHDLTLTPSVASKKPPKLEKLEVDARWAAGHGELDLIGTESGGHLLKLSGRGTPGDLSSVYASIEAASFDIAPVVAFAPGAFGAARGTLDAALTIKGLDPQTGDVRGMLHISEGRLPLAPTIGTLRKADINLTIAKQDVKATMSGRIGAGSVTGTLTSRLRGGMPSVADFALELRKISPIGALQPVIDGDVSGHFDVVGPIVKGKIAVKKGKVFVPPETGNDLLGAGTPGDMIFVGEQPIVKATRRQAAKPWLYADIDIGTTSVYVDDPNFLFDGTASGQLQLIIGDGLTLNGAISTERGAVDVLGRRYQLDHAIVDFDGTLDPRLDVRLIHDFKDLTLTVDVVGRASNPVPRLSGDPAKYTSGQLFAFLAGAEPGGDSGSEAGQAVVGGSLTLFTSRIGRRINKYLPVKLDTLNYEAGTATSSGAVRAGVRLSERSHILWRQRLEARPDENPGEAVLEYVFRPWMLLETTAGERAGGADLLLRKRW